MPLVVPLQLISGVSTKSGPKPIMRALDTPKLSSASPSSSSRGSTEHRRLIRLMPLRGKLICLINQRGQALNLGIFSRAFVVVDVFS